MIERKMWHGFMGEPETGTVWGKPIWRITVKDSPIDDETPCVLMEATPEGVGPFEERQARALEAIAKNRRCDPAFSSLLHEAAAAIRRVLDEGKGGA